MFLSRLRVGAARLCGHAASFGTATTYAAAKWNDNHAALLLSPLRMELTKWALPSTILPGNVRVAVNAVGICGSDVHCKFKKKDLCCAR